MLRTNPTFVHCMWHDERKHNGTIITMINNEPDFCPDDHLFLISNKDTYEHFKQYENVRYEPAILSKDMSVFRTYAEQAAIVFLHSNRIGNRGYLRLKKEILNKIVWCVWGHDLYGMSLSGKGWLYRYLSEIISKSKIKQFKAIGIGYDYDLLEIRRRYGDDLFVVALPYGYVKGRKAFLSRVSGLQQERACNTPYKIMIGHAAYEHLNHIKMMDLLSKYKQENIVISLVLAYGNAEYAKRVEEYAQSHFPGKVEIVKEYMSQEQYIHYLSTVDAAIFDYQHQSALGNMYSLAILGKKLFLKKRGVIKQGCMLNGIDTCNVEDIQWMNFEQFSERIIGAEDNRAIIMERLDERNDVIKWRNTLRELKNESLHDYDENRR